MQYSPFFLRRWCFGSPSQRFFLDELHFFSPVYPHSKLYRPGCLERFAPPIGPRECSCASLVAAAARWSVTPGSPTSFANCKASTLSLSLSLLGIGTGQRPRAERPTQSYVGPRGVKNEGSASMRQSQAEVTEKD